MAWNTQANSMSIELYVGVNFLNILFGMHLARDLMMKG